MDDDLDVLTREQLIQEVKRLSVARSRGTR
jgi:hypothetical protein